MILLFVKSYRHEFLSSFKKDGRKIFSLNVINELINISAVMVFTYATLLAPLSLVWVVAGFQPLFGFLLGLSLTLFAPHLAKENLEGKVITQKTFFIVIMFIGAYLLGR